MASFKVRVRVGFKEGILDPQSEVIQSALQHLDYKSVESVRCEKSFVIGLDAESEGQAVEVGREMANKILANLVMEDFDVEVLS